MRYNDYSYYYGEKFTKSDNNNSWDAGGLVTNIISRFSKGED